MSEMDAQDERIKRILGDNEDLPFSEAVDAFFKYLKHSLELPCEVTGIEDFRWEEFYIIGPGNRKEYKRLRKSQPSYQDRYELLDLENGVISEWMMFGGEDIAAHVRRKSDGKEFWLGLAELEAVEKKSRNYQLLDDYAVWFVNNR